ncbi:DNA polymerase III subunit delta' [Oxalobacter vibrioformis]|uniref:DNA polymerase III subunit delta' n=1 Tax=Oxalobacter vibrioformis TaxID=933080 RepID=A0A9E9P2J0_9BURK|nr:DNA polymerase III subunit delta' [Oxalobacter vibrioformis]WAW09957.1 DNA polymerase III subunit delta' [Oxalobacter vibrioformis]
MQASLPHAILLHGPVGTGKSAFAETLAKSLLCENRHPGGHACHACLSCGWFDQYAHLDYRRILPAALEAEKGAADEGAEAADGEDEKTAGRSAREPSRRIGIDQIRQLADVINLSTHRGGLRVICLWPAEALTTESANALLKMLEEPPPGTVFILVTNNINALLPTILSRCRKLAMPMPDFAAALAWLKAEGVADAETWLAEQGGAPVAALEEAQNGNREEMDVFLAALASPGVDMALKTAEKLQRSSARNIIAWLQRWLYDLLSLSMSGRQRYFPRYRKTLETQAASVSTDELLRLIKKTAERNRIAEHPLVLRLLIEDILLDYSRLFTR